MVAAQPALSTRWPWFRGGLSGLVAALLPLVWVVDTSSCGDHPGPMERTGVDIITNLDLAWWAAAPFLLVMVLSPFVARRVGGIPRAMVHLVGLGVTGFVSYCVFVVLFVAIFAERTIKVAGFLVAAAGAGVVFDALFRFVAGARELWKARAAWDAPSRHSWRSPS